MKTTNNTASVSSRKWLGGIINVDIIGPWPR